YSEAIEYLYSANRFCLSTYGEDVSTLHYLSWAFLPQRVAQIRDLRIWWKLDEASFELTSISSIDYMTAARRAWCENWDALSRLTGLRRLRVDLHSQFRPGDGFYESYWKDTGEHLSEAIKSVTIPQDFVVILPNRTCNIDIDLGDSKCVLKLPEDPRHTTMPRLT
ncbi:hypothetical protein EK21DRAFT_68098, partial [Setomelanomma holmii]